MKLSQNKQILKVIKEWNTLNCREISEITKIENSSCARSLNELSQNGYIESEKDYNPATKKLVKFYKLKNGQNNTPQRLPKKYKNGNFSYNQIKRGQKGVVYEVVTGYEVSVINEQKAKKVKMSKNVVEFKHKEKKPSPSDFGKTAFTYTDRKKAMNKFNEIEK